MLEQPPVLSLEKVPDWASLRANGPAFTKIVLGSLGEDAAYGGSLPEDFASVFPNLTHLHLWGLFELVRLPALPSCLKVLDVRNCKALREIADLPGGLETLDLGGNENLIRLPWKELPELRSLFIDRCGRLPDTEIEELLRGVARAPLQEMDASGCPGIKSLGGIPRSVRKLVLEECGNLHDASALGEFAGLDHLNLRRCVALTHLPAFPPAARYAVLHGADNLTRFLDQDLGPYDRGVSDDQNVAPILHARRKFGDMLASGAFAKLLLVGSGRAGKTTLARRLQWEELAPEARAQRPDLDPRKESPPTHKMKFWSWETALRVPEARKNEFEGLAERAEARSVPIAREGERQFDGTINIWDFGGQEIYHNTHRVFASEGSVFLIVWRPEAVDPNQLERERPQDVTPQAWNEFNRQHSLDYWLDYVESMRPDASVALVCTHTPKGQAQPAWTERAPRHADRTYPCFYVDSLDDKCGDNFEFNKLGAWIAERCGDEALRIGVLQPEFFKSVADRIVQMLQENDQHRIQNRRPKNLILPWNDWCREVRNVAGGTLSDRIEEADIEVVTGYLHDAGRVFLLRRGGESAVIVAMEWATELIYRMLMPGGDFATRILGQWGRFSEEDLEEEAEWKSLEGDLQRGQILDFMEACGIAVRVIRDHERSSGKAVFVANEKWLLPDPELPGVRSEIDRKRNRALRQSGMEVIEEFDCQEYPVSEFDFRGMMARLGAEFGSNALWFRNGLLAVPDDQTPDWCFSLVWRPESRGSYIGRLDARLDCKQGLRERLVKRIEEILRYPGSPIPPISTIARPADRSRAFSMETLFPLRPGQEDVGVSSSGAQGELVAGLVAALKKEKLRTVWYRSPECREGDDAKVKHFMEVPLRNARVLVLVLSDAYLADDPVNNWYCPWELADAILQWDAGKRPIARTLVLYAPDQSKVNSRTASDATATLFNSLAGYYHKKYAAVPSDQKLNYQHDNSIGCHFTSALQNGRVARLFEERGTLGTYDRFGIVNGETDYTTLVQSVKAALGARG